jgi:hypothetical protein
MLLDLAAKKETIGDKLAHGSQPTFRDQFRPVLVAT